MLIDVSSLVRRPAHRQRLLRDEASSSTMNTTINTTIGTTIGTTMRIGPLPRLADASNDDEDDIVDVDPDATVEDDPIDDDPVVVSWVD